MTFDESPHLCLCNVTYAVRDLLVPDYHSRYTFACASTVASSTRTWALLAPLACTLPPTTCLGIRSRRRRWHRLVEQAVARRVHVRLRVAGIRHVLHPRSRTPLRGRIPGYATPSRTPGAVQTPRDAEGCVYARPGPWPWPHFFDAASVGRAHALEDAACAVTSLLPVMLHLVGMHTDALDVGTAALNATTARAAAPQPDLTRAIVSSSCQASSFAGKRNLQI